MGLPTFLPYGPFTFDWKIFIPFFIAYMVAVMEALGVYQAASEIQGTSLERKQVRYGLAGEAAGSAISSLIGGFTTTAYPQNVGLLNLTGEGKLRTRTPVIIAAVLLLILGFVPKAGALLSVIPSAVVGGIFLPAAASLIVTGLRALPDRRRKRVLWQQHHGRCIQRHHSQCAFRRSSGFGGEASCAGVRGCSSSRSGGWDWRCGVR